MRDVTDATGEVWAELAVRAGEVGVILLGDEGRAGRRAPGRGGDGDDRDGR